VIRAVGEPARRFAEGLSPDPPDAAILGAVRVQDRSVTWAAAKAAAPQLTGLSAERVRDEWFKGLESARSVVLLADACATSAPRGPGC
jgi:hypothetical protein